MPFFTHSFFVKEGDFLEYAKDGWREGGKRKEGILAFDLAPHYTEEVNDAAKAKGKGY